MEHLRKCKGPTLVSATLTYASWNDYDNDNDLDVLITGAIQPSYLYKNTGGTFSIVNNTNLPVASGLKHAWADFDNDGDSDLGIPGSSGQFLLKNNKSNFSQIGAPAVSLSIAWGDYNNDGDMDYALGDGLYDNVDGVFTKRSTFTSGGAIAWADIDNDGDLDLITSSLFNSANVVTYRNDETLFTAVDQPNMTRLSGSDLSPASISAGDYDNDGDLDLLITGVSNSSPYTTGACIYINNGSGLFSKDQRFVLPQAGCANASWGDYDRDGDLDVLISGWVESSNNAVSKVLRNNLNNANNAPTSPSGLLATASNSKMTFSWSASTDAEGGPITYNLRVGTTPGGSEIMSAMASSTGQLLMPMMGNVQLNRSWTLNGINAGTYYWSVQAIDGAFRESAFATEQQAVINAQTITFAELSAVAANQAPYALSASASSGLPVTFTSSNPSVATISGNQITIISAGTTNITASQPGNNSFTAATPVIRVLTVNKVDQTITFSAVSTKTVGNVPFALSASASSALIVQYSTASGKVTLSGNTVTIVKAGSVTITAMQNGNGTYNSTSIAQTFCINPAKPTVTLSGADSENTLLTSSATTGNQWYLNDTAIPSATQATWHPAAAGVYTVKATVDGCSSELSNQVSLIVTGVLETAESKIKIYPNPADSQLIIELPAGSDSYILHLLHPDGSVLQTLETTQQTVEWDVHGLATGLYIVRVRHVGKTEHHKLIKL